MMGVTTLSVKHCPATPEDDGPEKGQGRLSLSRPLGLLVMTMYLNCEVHSEKALPRSSDVM